MAGKNTVLKSINDQDERRCVDIFRRPDGSFGFEEFRRDVEDRRGWFPTGCFGGRTFGSETAALREARSKVAWLCDAMGGR
ncbi:MAG: hypothetical protein RH942_11490 [Kiloniellaceae bacterium]